MPEIHAACEDCNSLVKAVFDPVTGTRQSEVIVGDLVVKDMCFVRDEIRFINNGRLIFAPRSPNEYFRAYYVICRKLIIVGGSKPGSLNPCGPEDPGQTYNANNVITWQDRLKSAASGPQPAPFKAVPPGASFDRNNWSDLGQGNNGSPGGAGPEGAKGKPGRGALNAPTLHLVVLEVEAGLGDHLTIDFDGQNGGIGGRGQNGGDGGDGMGGRISETDDPWPGSSSCARETGSGGAGGNGGNGGVGGDGGKGGDAGQITVITTAANLTSGPIVSGPFVFVNDGGQGGEGGLGGIGGQPGRGGRRGFKTEECHDAADGPDGLAGEPGGIPNGPGSNANRGSTGPGGASKSVVFEIITSNTCADMIPRNPAFDAAGLVPKHYCRGFATASTADGSLTGQYLKQITGVEVVGLANITVAILPTSTETQLNLRFNIAGNSGTGTGDLKFKRAFGADFTLTGAIEVEKFQVLTITPASGVRGGSPTVTIKGKCFDPTALLQQVTVSGFGVDVNNLVVVDEETVQCTFSIGSNVALVPATARDVTVKTGPNSRTLLNSFTVNP